MTKYYSTLYERVSAEERLVDWKEENMLPVETYAIHGGALPMITNSGLQGVLAASGIPQTKDHLLAVEILIKFLARKGEKL